MKYEVGDRILVLHSNEEGEVVELLGEQMVMIVVDGVRFPVHMDQIDFPYFKRFSDPSGKPGNQNKKEKKYIDDLKKEKVTTRYIVTGGVWLAFLPVFNKDVFDDDVVESFKLYLINQTDDPYNFTYNILFGGVSDLELKNQIYPLTDFYLHDIAFDKMNDSPRFEFEFSLMVFNKKKAAYFEVFLKLKAKQLFQKMEEMKIKSEPTFSYRLFKEYPDKIVEDIPDLKPLSGKGYRIYDASKPERNSEPPLSVIDLHIEKLTDDWKHLSNFEILTLQLTVFEKYYHLSIAHHQPNLIVIHGVGSGKLRNEIHEILKTKKEVKTFINQYHPNFGFGATEIYFQY